MREAEVVGRDALMAFHEALEQGAEADVGFSGLADAGTDGVEGFKEIGWEGVFEIGGKSAASEFFLDG